MEYYSFMQYISPALTELAKRSSNYSNSVYGKTGGYFHYTSLDVCLEIIKKKDNAHEMWASHLAFLNDKMEFNDGYQLIKETLKNREKDLERANELKSYIDRFLSDDSFNPGINANYYILCFCRNGDLLSQWKYYGRDSGIAIEFDLNNCIFSGFTTYKEGEKNFFQKKPVDVFYDKTEKLNIINENIDKIITTYNEQEDHKCDMRNLYFTRLMSIAAFFKDDSFKEEQEARLVFRPLWRKRDEIDSVKNLIHYRSNNGKIIPYMKIKMKPKDEKENIIKSLTVGPGRNQELIFQALIHYASKNGEYDHKPRRKEMEGGKACEYLEVNGIEIRKSLTPFRD